MKAGFALIELLVVLVIIGLVSAVVVPRLFSTLGNLNLKTAAQQTAATLRYDRSKAVAEKLSRAAVFNLEARSVRCFSMGVVSSVEKQDRIEAAKADMTFQMPEGVRIQKAVFGEDVYETGEFTVLFYPNGSSTGGAVVLAGESGKRFEIMIDAITGIVKVSDLGRDG